MISAFLKKHLPKPLIETLVTLKYAREKIPNHKIYEAAVAGKKGIEIGGPSHLFKSILPVYQKAADLDCINFSNNTTWEGAIQSGRNFNYFGNKWGVQYISDATDLSQIQSDTYDFLLSSHCLEHVANPLRALGEWKRAIRPGGALILVLPDKASNFDRNRPYTSFEHILDDFRNETTEHDLTHLQEILDLHDLSMDPPAGTPETFRKRSLDNFKNRTLHHHVFNIDVMKQMLTHIGFDIEETSESHGSLFALATKTVRSA